MIRTKYVIFTAVGTVGIYLAHWIENKIQYPDKPITYNINHVNRVALYWTLGALAYFVWIENTNVLSSVDSSY